LSSPGVDAGTSDHQVSFERWLLIAAALLWGASLALPAVQVTRGPALSGYEMLEQGVGAWRDGVLAWYANPALIVALLLGWLRRYRPMLFLALSGLVLALSSFAAGTLAESAGRSVPPFAFTVGFYVWLAAFAAATLAGATGIYKVSKFRNDQE
jgi:hypothetical protein